ncbi:MAG: NAD(P)-dependent oxidoreductase [Haloferacaceae archaeon]
MSRVILPEYPMVDVETYRRVLEGVATVEVAAMDDADDVVAAASDAEAVVVDVSTPVPASVFERLPDLRAVARSSVGVAGVDVAAAAEAGVAVLHAPAYCLDEVATHAVALLLACVRAVPEYDRAVRAGEWPRKPSRPLHRLRGRTLGLVAFGRIARAVRERVAGFDLDVVAYDPYVDPGTMVDADVGRVGREELFARADHVSVHAPDTTETRGLVDADALGALPADGVVVNTGRGGIVDEDALAAALEADDLGAAGLDVFEEEPLPADSPLRGRDDVVFTPHAAWYSEEARRDVNETIARDLRRVLTGATPENAVDPGADWL